jgi:hypothetical protein
VEYDVAISPREAVRRIERNDYVLPNIQRSFVWSRKQIIALFDSLLRGYPIGSIVVWRTTPQANRDLGFRHFVTDHFPDTELAKANVSNRPRVDAVLDGQQRLTALNIGLRGSYYVGPRGREPKILWLDLGTQDDDAGAEQNAFAFEFLGKSERSRRAEGLWFPIPAMYGLSRSNVDSALGAFGLSKRGEHRRRLVDVVSKLNEGEIPVHVEKTDDLDRVLNVFARINMAGTTLSYVDLLVSTASAQWKQRDAKEAITGLRSQLNAMGAGFRFTDDRIVKAGLVLVDADPPKFHVDAFRKRNKGAQLERDWELFAAATEVAVAVLASFGLSARTMAAENVMIPIAYYAQLRKLRRSYATAALHERDRQLVRAFVARTLLRRGYWTGAVDPVLTETRQVIKSHGKDGFPLLQIAKALSGKNKSIDVDDQFIEDLAELPIGDRRTLALLRLLYPDVKESARLDKDHVFPWSKFDDRYLQNQKVPAGKIYDWMWMCERLPNLQLLDTADNTHKSAKLPLDWISTLTPTTRKKYRQQDLDYLPAKIADFEDFWYERRTRLEKRIRHLLIPIG